VWFPGVRLNWAERAFAGKEDESLAILAGKKVEASGGRHTIERC
jgi:hypothetical protein